MFISTYNNNSKAQFHVPNNTEYHFQIGIPIACIVIKKKDARIILHEGLNQ